MLEYLLSQRDILIEDAFQSKDFDEKKYLEAKGALRILEDVIGLPLLLKTTKLNPALEQKEG